MFTFDLKAGHFEMDFVTLELVNFFSSQIIVYVSEIDSQLIRIALVK